MSEILLVTYDLKTPGKDYSPFYAALKAQGPWWHYMGSTWLIATNKSAKQVYDNIATHLTVKDLILVAPLGSPHWGYLPKEAWEWISKNRASIRPLAQ
jgi:hypothetical protein